MSIFWHSCALSVLNNTRFWTHIHSYFYFILSTIHLFIKTVFKYLFIIYTFVHTSYRHLHLEIVLHTTGAANYIFIVWTRRTLICLRCKNIPENYFQSEFFFHLILFFVLLYIFTQSYTTKHICIYL